MWKAYTLDNAGEQTQGDKVETALEAMNGDNEENGFILIAFFHLFSKFYEKNYFNFSEIIWSEKVNKLGDFRKKSPYFCPIIISILGFRIRLNMSRKVVAKRKACLQPEKTHGYSIFLPCNSLILWL